MNDLTLPPDIENGAVFLAKMNHHELVDMIVEMVTMVSPRNTFDGYMLTQEIKALAANTLIAYVECIKAVNRAGLAFPMTEQQAAAYIESLFDDGLAPSTVAQRMAAINKLHSWLAMSSPITKGIRQVYKNRMHEWSAAGNRQRQARALLKRDVFAMLDAVHGEPVKVLRDTAMLLIGYTAAMRRAELCQMRYEHLEFDDYGVKIHLPTTKTRKFGDTKRVLREPESSDVCPVRILQAWMQQAKIDSGAIWRPIDRHGNVRPSQITTHGFNYALKHLAEWAGIDTKQISGHSLRAGVCTQLAIDGVPTYKIQRLGAWANLHMLHERYLRDVDMVTDNAAAGLWKDARLSGNASKVQRAGLLEYSGQ